MVIRGSTRPQPTNEERIQLASDLEALSQLRIDAMRTLWNQRLNTPYPPRLKSPEIFRGLLGRNLRDQVEGGLSAAARRKLAEIERKAQTGKRVELLPRLNIGSRLERDYRGVLHEVDVVDGGFLHQGTTYESLSEVARAITGVRWSGPRFFGLKATAI